MFAKPKITGLTLALSLLAGAAYASDWTVVKSSSAVQFTTDKTTWQTVTPGMTLPNKSWINTGSRGRITLKRDTNVINLNPGTLAGVFNLGGALDKTVVAQQTGVVALDLERKSAPWMTVQTPFLAAVVKGTKFEVSIGKKDATVSVERGRVQVTDPHRGEQVDVVAGQKADVDVTSSTSMDVSGAGKIESVQKVAKTEAVVPLSQAQQAEIDNTTEAAASTSEKSSSKSSKTSGSDKSSSASTSSDSGSGSSGKSGSSSSSSSNSSSGKSGSSSSSSSSGKSSSSSSGSKSNSGKSNSKGNSNDSESGDD